ncbi:DUF3794 and LysM peptidoglycan-binding domain-containing protein [Candidatus Arthromitus sp. SFB-rat-Yit]|uniref:DUF3794 and LysM peptidoglycan-binding domain-containing protein n=1 Tax=Candidatus Arthromitus sp. SFB-rat-Yit TaxID=1041504 RepID=UPI000227A684|nr:SPOCS domain-containing protein [Candidatus Arthromitus sp. SFB-rat-Yit]BAK81686.1 LysM domain protein [Candidatus Arthromitus sp. SFB-rat-Yit]
MEEINLIKQKISYECKNIEGHNDFVVKGEYLIPDTHPDVDKILLIEVKPRITNTEAFLDKIFVEGELVYSIVYVAVDDEKNNTYNVSYSDKFNLYIESVGMRKENLYNIKVNVSDKKFLLLNERKISIEANLKFSSNSNEILDVDIVSDIEDQDDIQFLMKELEVCELKGTFTEELINETSINVPLDKGDIGKILICDSYIYKTECKLLDNKITYNAYCKVKVLYKEVNSDNLNYLEQDIYLTKDCDVDGIDSSMIPVYNWDVIGFEYMIDEDESGESRIINSYINIRCNLKVLSKNILSIIDDAYSKNYSVNLVKNNYKINNVESHGNIDTIIKDNINVEDVPVSIIYTTGVCNILNKKVLEGKLVIEGVINTEVIYKNSEGQFLNVVQAIPFTTNFDDENIKIDMDAVINENLENIEAFIEAKTIGIKAVINIRVYINSEIKRDILVDMYKTQEETPLKECSVIIYITGEDDTLWSIAKKYCVSIEDICRINNLDQEDEIVGCKLLLPSKAVF